MVRVIMFVGDMKGTSCYMLLLAVVAGIASNALVQPNERQQ